MACSTLAFSQNPESLTEDYKGHMDKGNYAKAVKPLSKLISLFPDSADLYARKGQCQCYAGEIEEAMVSFGGAYDADPENFYLYMLRGNCFMDYRYYDKAVQDFTERRGRGVVQ